MNTIRFIYIPITRAYKSNRGLSERLIKNKLEKEKWEVWRGGAFNILKQDEVYPNVQWKYMRLFAMFPKEDILYFQYLCHVHHGMPDFVCAREEQIKFVECKLGHEQLSTRQRTCIKLLKHRGYEVEVHKLVNDCTRTRIAYIDLDTGKKVIKEQQAYLRLRW
ncbi:VRR-NUC domain-containing protein [Candidatus Woesearchaeota archaeon]|nr:VRR-NUC domain-containing protein [Candidatus Woesearchaeota archaeon]